MRVIAAGIVTILIGFPIGQTAYALITHTNEVVSESVGGIPK